MMDNFHKYLDFDAKEEGWGFTVTNCGYAKVSSRQAYPPERQHPKEYLLSWDKGRVLNSYQLIYIAHGKGIFMSEHVEQTEVSGGQAFLLSPGVWHRYRPNFQVGWEEYWMGFQGYYADELVKRAILDPTQPIWKVGNDEMLVNLYKTLLDAVKTTPVGYKLLLPGMALQVINWASSKNKQEPLSNDKNTQIIETAKFLIREGLEGNIPMTQLADKLNVSYSWFRRTFKEYTGVSPAQYHLHLRLEKAKTLLSSTFLNISEISRSLGFESVFHFSRLFRNKTGIPPKDYRQQHNPFQNRN